MGLVRYNFFTWRLDGQRILELSKKNTRIKAGIFLRSHS